MSATVVSDMKELPVLQEEPPERADAARNRGKVLAAAERLFAEHGADCVTMDAVAAAAGVGKGTLFRRFGDRAGLVFAVLGERERRLQEEIIRGPAPLGPGAPPEERLVAFCRRLLEHLVEHGDMIAAAERHGPIRFRSPPFQFYRLHVATLLREADPELDAEFFADALLATLRADQVAYLRHVREMSDERIVAGWARLLRGLLSCR